MPFARPENRGEVGDTPGPDQWFKALPIITQLWFGTTVVLTLSVNFGIISAFQILWSWRNVKSKFELWRILTPFCYAGPFDFNTLISVYMLVQFSKQYEAGGPFNTGAGGGTADYAFAMLFGMIVTLLTYPVLIHFFPLPPVFCRNMIYFVLYIWSKRNPTAPANIWGFQMQGIYMPFAYLAFSVFIGNSYLDMIHGMAVGHVYYFLVDVVPLVYGKDVLTTPQFLIDYFGIGEFRPQMQPPPRGQEERPNRGGFGGSGGGGGGGGGGRPLGGGGGGGHNWGGGGQTLGRS